MIDNLKYLFVLFPFIGIALFVFGLAYRRRLKVKAALCCERVQGSVVDNKEEVNYGTAAGIKVYVPIVEYVVGSSQFKVTAGCGYSPPLTKGTRMMVMYNPANHSDAFVEKDYYKGANILLLIGGAFMTLGSIFAYVFCS